MLITYFLDNKLGGVTSLNYNLAANCPDKGVHQFVIHIDQQEWNMTRAGIAFPVDREVRFLFSGNENEYSVLQRLRKQLPDEPGALVLNYGMEMAMLDHHAVSQTTYQLVHDEYNVRLAAKYGHVADVFICHNRHIEQRLHDMLPGRKNDIYYLPHGVAIPDAYRKHEKNNAPLKLLFLGRMTEGKGIFDLPEISRLLAERSVPFEWTCIGNGPRLEELKQRWNPGHPVRFLSPAGNDEVMRICAGQDVFVLPTKFEGSPVSLLETMSAGLVPVISALPGGIMEAVSPENGFTVPVDNNEAFADSIAVLHHDREKLADMGKHARQRIMEKYDVRKTAAAYHRMFADYGQYYKPKKLKRLKVGSRLDQPWLPSGLVRVIRKLMSK